MGAAGDHARALVVPLDGRVPDVSGAAFLAPGAVIVGAVTLGAGTSVWYGCVLRADGGPIVLGRDVNVQDGCILHADPGFPTSVGDRCSLGHGAVVHGATLEEGVLVGMRATVLNGAHVGAGSLVAAGAVVRPGMVVPPGSLVAGVPAVVRREVSEDERRTIAATTATYLGYAAEHRRAVDAAAQSGGAAQGGGADA